MLKHRGQGWGPDPTSSGAIAFEEPFGMMLNESETTSTGAVAQATRPSEDELCVIPCVNHRFFLWIRGAPSTPLFRDGG
jgi:hypothetical protein